MADGETTNEDLKKLMLEFMAESRADRLALWVAVRAQEGSNTVSTADVQKIRADLAEIREAVGLPLAIHRWTRDHKMKTRFLGFIGLAAIPVVSQLVGVIFHRLGWS